MRAAAALLAVSCASLACAATTSVPATPARPAAPPPDLVFETSLSGVGSAETLSVWLAADGAHAVLAVDGAEGRWVGPLYPAWWVAVGELDGDGRDEVVLGVWSRTKRHDEPEPHRAAWILAWRGDGLVPTWKGSALARPIADLALADLDGDGLSELVALERSGDRCTLTAYRAGAFGFEGRARMATPCETTQLLGGDRLSRAGAPVRLSLVEERLVLVDGGAAAQR